MNDPPEYYHQDPWNDPRQPQHRPRPAQRPGTHLSYAVNSRPAEPAAQWWLKRAGGGLALCGLLVGVLDILQPLAPFAWLAIGASIFGLALVGALISIMRNVNQQVHERLVELACFLAVVLVGSAGIKVAQAVTPGGSKSGFFASHSPELRQMQSSLLGIEQRLVSFGEGLGRVESGVGRIEHTTGTIDTRTAHIATDVQETKRELQGDRDPVTQAQRAKQAALLKLEELGLTADNVGFMKAVMQSQYEAQSQYSVLGIAGDEKSLRQALLENRVGSPEFKGLHQIFLQLHAGHYAMPVVNEFRAMLKGVRQTGSADAIRQATCGSAAPSFVGNTLKTSVAEFCADDAGWFRETVGVLKELNSTFNPPDPNRMQDFQWWYSAESYLRFTPASSRKVSLQELLEITALGASAPAEAIRVDATYYAMDPHLVVRVGEYAPGVPRYQPYLYGSGDPKLATCKSAEKACRGRVFFITGTASGLKPVAVDGGKPGAVSAN